MIVAFIISLILCKGFGLFNIWDYILFTLFGSLLPDIDTRDSKLGRFNPFAVFMTHRGITHTLLAAGVCTILFFLFGLEAGICLGIGYLSHLWLDSATPSGIQWLYPFVKRKVGI